MADDIEFHMTYPCYFLYADQGGLVCSIVDGRDCLCLFTSTPMVQRFQHAKQLLLHGPNQVDLEVVVDKCDDYDALIARLKSGETDLATAGVRHIVIDPVP